MKRLLFLGILLLIGSLLSCSNSDDSVIGPGPSDQFRNSGSATSVHKLPAAETDGEDEGDPWEDHRPDGGGDKGPIEPGPVEDPGKNNDTIYPNDPGGGD